jgi:hypothetical protein
MSRVKGSQKSKVAVQGGSVFHIGMFANPRPPITSGYDKWPMACSFTSRYFSCCACALLYAVNMGEWCLVSSRSFEKHSSVSKAVTAL